MGKRLLSSFLRDCHRLAVGGTRVRRSATEERKTGKEGHRRSIEGKGQHDSGYRLVTGHFHEEGVRRSFSASDVFAGRLRLHGPLLCVGLESPPVRRFLIVSGSRCCVLEVRHLLLLLLLRRLVQIFFFFLLTTTSSSSSSLCLLVGRSGGGSPLVFLSPTAPVRLP